MKQQYQYFDGFNKNRDYQELDNPFIAFVAGLSIFAVAYLMLIIL